MKEQIYQIAANVGTPLALAGITIAFFTRIILRILDKLATARAEHTPEILKRILNRFFVLAVIAFVLGGAGWIYAKWVEHDNAKEKRAQQAAAIDRFTNLITVLRNETSRLLDEYPTEFQQLVASGKPAEEARNEIYGRSRRAIDEKSAGDTLAHNLRISFPQFEWDFFLPAANKNSKSFESLCIRPS